MKITPATLREMKQRGKKIAALTAYDFFTAKIMDEAGIELILIGDSLGMAVLGYENTLPVTMEEMLHHTRAVARAQPQALVVADMPFHSYTTVEQAIENAGKFIAAGAQAVKLEGGVAVADRVAALSRTIPVLGHIGLLPQSIAASGGYRVQGRTAESAAQVLRDAQVVEQAMAAWGRIDVLVNNAGISAPFSLMQSSLEDWRKIQAVNMDGVFLGLRHVGPVMAEGGGGSVINLSSIMGKIGAAGCAASCCSWPASWTETWTRPARCRW